MNEETKRIIPLKDKRKHLSDKFIKSLTEAEKIELVALVKEHNTLGE